VLHIYIYDISHLRVNIQESGQKRLSQIRLRADKSTFKKTARNSSVYEARVTASPLSSVNITGRTEIIQTAVIKYCGKRLYQSTYFFFFLYRRYNPLWVLAFSVIFFLLCPFFTLLSPPSYSHYLQIFFNVCNQSFPWSPPSSRTYRFPL
jgi:hypothetical protein